MDEEEMQEEELEMEEEDVEEEEAEERQQVNVPDAGPQQPQRVRLNFDEVSPQYANFCTLNVRQGEVFLSFGKAFVPSEELKIDSQIVMSIRNVKQLYQAIGRVLQQQGELPE